MTIVVMFRALVLAVVFFVIPRASLGQELSVLHIKVALVDAERKATPVPHHVLLISDNPSSAPPRRVITGNDGTADVHLRPGNYTVESDRAVAFLGNAYQWTQMLDIAAGRDAVLELTADNAAVEPVGAGATTSSSSPPAPMESDPSTLLMQWQDSVVALWTPTTRASGFLIDARGFIATSRRIVGSARSVEVQITPTVKVTGNVLVADLARDVAILWIDPAVIPSIRPVPLGCSSPSKPLVEGQDVFTIGTPVREQKGVTPGILSHVEPQGVTADFSLARGSLGGPVFAADGAIVGVTSVGDERDQRRRASSRVVRIDQACNALAAAEKKMQGASPPSGRLLPVEPERPFPVDAMKDAVQRRAGSLNPYQISSSDFDIAFITPVLAYGAQNQLELTGERDRGQNTRRPDAEHTGTRPLTDFSNWSEYVADVPPVLLVRVTPKLVEAFWTTVARGAAQTQGMAIPAIKHAKSGFSRLRAFCGDAEVTPIHPFTIEQRVSEIDVIDEGLYVFDPGALGPPCGTVKLTLYSEKAPEKGETRTIDPKLLQQIWQDFAPYREVK